MSGIGPAGIGETAYRAIANDRAVVIEKTTTLAAGASANLAVSADAGKLILIEKLGIRNETNQSGKATLEVYRDDDASEGTTPAIFANRNIGESLPEGVTPLAAVTLSGSEELVFDRVFVGELEVDAGFSIKGPKTIVFVVTNNDASSGDLEISVSAAVLDG